MDTEPSILAQILFEYTPEAQRPPVPMPAEFQTDLFALKWAAHGMTSEDWAILAIELLRGDKTLSDTWDNLRQDVYRSWLAADSTVEGYFWEVYNKSIDEILEV